MKKARQSEEKHFAPLTKARCQVNVILASIWYAVGWRIRDDPRAWGREELVPAPRR